MIKTRTFAIVALGLALSASALVGQGRSRYRDFQLGSDLPSIAALAKMAPSDAKTIHQRPAVLQELQWRPPYFASGSTTAPSDPVQQVVFSFYNDQLFRLIVSYNRQRTDGMTDGDMVDALSQEYGATLAAGTRKAPGAAADTDAGAPVARWGDGDFSVVLYRSPYGAEFSVIVSSVKLEALARTASAQAIRLDEREAPLLETARLKKEAEDARLSQEKARLANKAAFRP